MIFNYLPQDIIQYILSYNDTIKYRNGKYMNQISKDDDRYKLLLNIPLLDTDHCGILIRYIPTKTLWCVTSANSSIYYTFFYDCGECPHKCDLWIRY